MRDELKRSIVQRREAARARDWDSEGSARRALSSDLASSSSSSASSSESPVGREAEDFVSDNHFLMPSASTSTLSASEEAEEDTEGGEGGNVEVDEGGALILREES